MNIGGLLFLLMTQYLCGRGLLELFRLQVNKLTEFCFSMLCGVALFSFPPFFIQLLHIPITLSSVTVAILILTALLSIPLIPKLKTLFTLPKFHIKLPALYEYPFYIIFLLLILLSLWRCYYLPPNARDMTSGPELMAQLAISEKTMINSMFNIDLQSTNNYLKPPYITSLQIVYKLFVSPLGQTWLSITFLSFVIWIFSLLREKLHPIFACFAMLLFFAMPELFGYTYLMLFDYSNMVFFASAVYFLSRYFEEKRLSDFAFSIFLFTIATYIRTETPILIALFIPLIMMRMLKEKIPILKIGIRIAALMIFPAIIYYLCMNVFVKHYIPIHYDVSSDVNKNLGNLTPLFDRIGDICTKLMLGQGEGEYSFVGYHYYGYFFPVFVMILGIDIAFFIGNRKQAFQNLKMETVTLLYGIAVVYFGLALIGFILPLADLMHTTKRGLFKMLPLIILYYRNSGILQFLSAKITNWENGIPKPKPVRTPVAQRVPIAQNRPAAAPKRPDTNDRGKKK